jgi:ankyrin repeat protein
MAREEDPPATVAGKSGAGKTEGWGFDDNVRVEAMVDKLVQCGADAINTTSPLMCAVISRKASLVDKLLSAGADTELTDRNGTTALMFGALSGDAKVVKALLQGNASPHAADTNRGDNALHRAAALGHTAAIEALIQGGADVNVANKDGCTALFWACLEGHIKSIELLIKHAAFVNVPDAQGVSPLMICARAGHHKALEALIWAGASVNTQSKNGSTALMEASQGGHEQCIEILVRSEAIVNVINHEGYTPLLLAQTRGHTSARALLRTHGARHRFGLLNFIVTYNFVAAMIRQSREVPRWRYAALAAVLATLVYARGDEPKGVAPGCSRPSVPPFWEYRQDQPREFDIAAFAMYTGPRCALLFMEEFIPPDGHPLAQVGWAEWLLLPELYIIRHRALILGGLPILVPAALVGSASLRIMHILTLSSCKDAGRMLLRILGWEATTVLGLIIAWHLYDVFCPLYPSFVCESGLLLWSWIFVWAPLIRVCFS